MQRWLAAVFMTMAATGVEAQTLERLAADGVLRIGYRETALPFSFRHPTTGAPSGYTVSLCEAIATDIAQAAGIEQFELEFVTVDAANRFAAVAEGQIDMLCGAATKTLSRREQVDFSIPTFVDGAGIALPVNGARSMADLAGGTIAVTAGTTTAAALQRMLDDGELRATLVEVTDHEQGLAQLAEGAADAYFADRAILHFLIETSDVENVVVAGEQFTLETYAIALPRGDTEFRLAVDRGLSRLYLTGEVEALFTQAFGVNAEMSDLLRALYRVSALPR